MSELLNLVIDALQADFEDLAEELREDMVEEAHKKTGALKDSIIKEKLSDTSYFVGVDGEKLKNNSKNEQKFDYSKSYWKGRKEVRPVKAKSLRFEIDGKVIYAKKSKATKGDPFVERAIGKFNK